MNTFAESGDLRTEKNKTTSNGSRNLSLSQVDEVGEGDDIKKKWKNEEFLRFGIIGKRRTFCCSGRKPQDSLREFVDVAQEITGATGGRVFGH